MLAFGWLLEVIQRERGYPRDPQTNLDSQPTVISVNSLHHDQVSWASMQHALLLVDT